MRALSCHPSRRALHFLLAILLIPLLLNGCAGSNSDDDDDGGGDQESEACISSEQESVPATFTHSVSSGVLNLEISQSGVGEYSLLYCVPAPHGGNYRGIEATATFVTTTATSGDVNLLLTPYETSNGNLIYAELILQGTTAVAFIESCSADDSCTALLPDYEFASELTQGNPYTISILWDGNAAIDFDVSSTPGYTHSIDLGTYPIVNSNLTDAEVAFDLYARQDSGGSALTQGTIEDVALSTDGTSFTPYDDFSVADGPYDGGGKWFIYTGTD